jgi:serine protease Do
MKQNWIRISMLALVAAMLSPVAILAQEDKMDKGDKGDKDKTRDVQQIIVTRKSDKADKVVIEVNGDKVTVNGKPLDEYKDKNGDVTVSVNKWKDAESLFTRLPGTAWSGGNKFDVFTSMENRAMLGVSTEKNDKGVEVLSVTKESAAEKAGLKEKDIITRIDDQKMEEPDDLSTAVQKHKAGDKISITYLRDGKEQKATAELTKWKGGAYWNGDQNFKFDLGDLKMDHVMPKVRAPYAYAWTGNGPKLGLSVQDSDDGKGVKVIEVDDESNAAKAGIKENDIITEADGKAINNADDMVKVIRDSKEKISIMLKVNRGGKTENVDVKMPRKLKTADL